VRLDTAVLTRRRGPGTLLSGLIADESATRCVPGLPQVGETPVVTKGQPWELNEPLWWMRSAWASCPMGAWCSDARQTTRRRAGIPVPVGTVTHACCAPFVTVLALSISLPLTP